MKNIRLSREYKKMRPFDAVSIAEGFGDGEGASEKEQLAAWQYLVDKGICWRLQGFFGRTAAGLIENGVIKAAN